MLKRYTRKVTLYIDPDYGVWEVYIERRYAETGRIRVRSSNVYRQDWTRGKFERVMKTLCESGIEVTALVQKLPKYFSEISIDKNPLIIN